MLEKINLTIAVIGVFFGSLFLMALKDYLDYSATIAKNKLILYSFIDKKSPISGRSRVYKVHYEYNNQKGEVDILLKDYKLIEMEKYPELYYSEKMGVIFSKYNYENTLWRMLIFAILFILCVISLICEMRNE